MTSKFRKCSKNILRNNVATAHDLEMALQRAETDAPKETFDAFPETPMPLQAPRFLKGMPRVGQVYNPQEKITKELAAIIDANYYTENFVAAIQTVAEQKIAEISRIKTLDQFYFYVDTLSTWMPEIRVWDWDGQIYHERTVYLRLTQFYYYFNQPSLEALQSPIEPGDNTLSPISKWLREFAISWGSFLDTPESARYLESFKYAPEYTWQEYKKAPEDYNNFNEFFARTFKDIEVQRPVARPSDDRVIAFPAESTFVGQWAISTKVGSPLPAPPSIVVKNIQWSIGELLADSQFGDEFEGGIFCHSFLNSFDYHRQHAPVSGKILEAKFIPGQVYLEVNLTTEKRANASLDDNYEPAYTHSVKPNRYLDAEDGTGYQFVQCRGLIIIDNPVIGKVAVLPMGMAQVSSVVFVHPKTHQPIALSPEEQKHASYEEQVALLNAKIRQELVGKHLDKGEMMSYFQFGGSDIVMAFQREACVDITAQIGIHYPIRSQYAVANGEVKR